MTRSALGSIRQRFRGAWELRYAGHSRAFRGTRKEAALGLAMFISELTGRPPTISPPLKVMIRTRIDTIRATSAETTIAEYERLLAKRIEPDLIAARPIDTLTSVDLKAFYGRLPSPGIVRPVHRLIASSLAQAVEAGWLDRNVGQIRLRQAPRKKRTMPPAANLRSLLAELLDTNSSHHNPDMAALIAVAVSTGMRRGELCGLRWDAVNLNEAQITVRRAVVSVSGRLIDKGTKTHTERTMDLAPYAVDALEGHRDRVKKRARIAKVRLIDSRAHVWSLDPDGATPFHPDSVTKAWRRAADRHSLGEVRFHDLRHSFATTLLASGAFSMAEVADQMGHASPAVTAAVYAHGTNRGKDAAAVMQQLMEGE